MSKTLILWGYDGFNQQYLRDLEIISKNLPKSTAILMEEGVNGIINIDSQKGALSYKKIHENFTDLFCLSEDLIARGYKPALLPNYVKLISYPEIIDLIAQSERLISRL